MGEKDSLCHLPADQLSQEHLVDQVDQSHPTDKHHTD